MPRFEDIHDNDDNGNCEECGDPCSRKEPCGCCEAALMESDSEERDYDYDGSVMDFADPGGRSALRAASATNPRDLPCPTCGRENMLTPKDVALAYCCDICADAAEGYGP